MSITSSGNALHDLDVRGVARMVHLCHRDDDGDDGGDGDDAR